MNTFKPELCVIRATKPGHYSAEKVKEFAIAAGFSKSNMKLGKRALCNKLKERYRNAVQPNRNAVQPNRNAVQPNRNAVQPNNRNVGARLSRVRKGKNKREFLAKRSPLLFNIRKNPNQFKTLIKSRIKNRTVVKKIKTIQKTGIKKILNKYIKIHYKDIPTQLTNKQKNPLLTKNVGQSLKDAVLLHSGELNSETITRQRLANARSVERLWRHLFIKYVLLYATYKNNSNSVIQSIKVPVIWKPSIGKNKLKIEILGASNFLRCSLNKRDKLTLDNLVYIETEVINNKIEYFYNKTNLIAHMDKKGYCPVHKWRQLEPEKIKRLHPTVLENSDPDIQGLLKVRELIKIHRINVLLTVEQMLSEVHTISNKNKVIIHARNTQNILERRGNCGLSVMMLYDLIQEQKNKADQVEMLTELGENLPVCIEAKCNFIREFVEEKKAGIQFNYNSGMPKDRIIGDACLYYIKKWCKESEGKSNSRAYFLGKLPDLFTRVQAKLQNKNSKNGKIDYTDILRVILEQGEYMIDNCEGHNFNNINVNTENQKRALFGMHGVL